MRLLINQYEDLIKEAQDALQFQGSMSAKEADYWITQEVKAKYKLNQLSNFKPQTT